MAEQYLTISVPTPTQNPVPSADIRDHVFGGAKIDEFVTSIVNTYIDRLGVEHYTVEGITNHVKQAIGSLGWVPFGTFAAGATLTNATQALKYEADGNYYRWDGDFDKEVPAGSTPETSGGVAHGAWVNVTDITLRTALASANPGSGAGMVNTESGKNVQEEIDRIKNNIEVITELTFQTFEVAKEASIKPDVIYVNYKYGKIKYKYTGQTEETKSSSGDGYLFYDHSGKEFLIDEQKRAYSNDGRFAFTELWHSVYLDPSFFFKLSDLGVSNVVLYSWLPFGLESHKHMLDLCYIFGIGVVFQPVSNGQYSDNIPNDFLFFASILDHPAIVGLYLLDEPSFDTYPMDRQAVIISTAKGYSDKPLYVSINSEANFNGIPVHKDIDFVFTSNYSHYVNVEGLQQYAATSWALAEENGFRKGRVIPLLTAYYYPEEVPTFNKEQMLNVNDYIVKAFDKFGMFMFWGGRDGANHKYIENDDDIFSLIKSSLSRFGGGRTLGMFRELMTGGVAPTGVFKYYEIPLVPENIIWLSGSTSTNWDASAKCPRLKPSIMIPVYFARPVVLERVIASFIDNNGPGNNAVISIYFNPEINAGVKHTETKSITGGGDAVFSFASYQRRVRGISISVDSMTTSTEYLNLVRLGVVYREI